MATQNVKYGTLGVAITWTTLATQTSSINVGTNCLAIDNTSNLYLDAEVYFTIGLAASVPVGDILIGLVPSADGTNYATPGTGTDATCTLPVAPQAPVGLQPGQFFPGTGIYYVGRIACLGQGASATVKAGFPDICAAVGIQQLPIKWGLFALNQTGGTLLSGSATYTGVVATVA